MPFEIANKSYGDTTIRYNGAGTYTIPLANLGVDVSETISFANIKRLMWSTNGTIQITRNSNTICRLHNSGEIKFDEWGYSVANNNTGNIVVTITRGGLLTMQLSKKVGEPAPPIEESFTFYEAIGDIVTISTTQYVNNIKIYAESSTYDVPNYQPARIVVNDIEIANTEARGHTLVVLNPYGNVVTGPTQYDTYIDTNNVTLLTSALNAVSSKNIVILVSYDASAFNASARSAINTGYGSTNTDTWTPIRYSHIFIGKKT
jgi:hypothetical protein